jgi:hypothetical protein
MTVDGEKSTAKRLAGDSHRIEEDPLQVCEIRGGRHGVSKGVEDCRRLLALRVAIPKMAVRLFQGWLPAAVAARRV